MNIAVDGEHSPYALDRGEREQAITFSKRWIDAAAAIGSSSVRTNIPAAKDSEPDLGHTVEALKRVVEYAEAKNVVVNLENDNPVSEDPFFLIQVVEKVNSPWLHALPRTRKGNQFTLTSHEHSALRRLTATRDISQWSSIAPATHTRARKN